MDRKNASRWYSLKRHITTIKEFFCVVPIETRVGVTGFKDEIDDCSVRALANSHGIRYIESHRAHEIQGRNFGSPISVWDCSKIYERYGFEVAVHRKYQIDELPVLPKRFQRNELLHFLRNHKTGKYILIVKKKTKTIYAHSIAVVDGVVIDNGESLPSNLMVLLVAKSS